MRRSFASALIAETAFALVHGVPGIGKTNTRESNLESSSGLNPYFDFRECPKPNFSTLSKRACKRT